MACKRWIGVCMRQGTRSRVGIELRVGAKEYYSYNRKDVGTRAGLTFPDPPPPTHTPGGVGTCTSKRHQRLWYQKVCRVSSMGHIPRALRPQAQETQTGTPRGGIRRACTFRGSRLVWAGAHNKLPTAFTSGTPSITHTHAQPYRTVQRWGVLAALLPRPLPSVWVPPCGPSFRLATPTYPSWDPSGCGDRARAGNRHTQTHREGAVGPWAKGRSTDNPHPRR